MRSMGHAESCSPDSDKQAFSLEALDVRKQVLPTFTYLNSSDPRPSSPSRAVRGVVARRPLLASSLSMVSCASWHVFVLGPLYTAFGVMFFREAQGEHTCELATFKHRHM